MGKNSKLPALIEELKKASRECIDATILLNDTGKKIAPLCIQILIEVRHIPKFFNNLIEDRMRATGLDPINPDFWNAGMIIALIEYFEN